jgi:hypothetical protein
MKTTLEVKKMNFDLKEETIIREARERAENLYRNGDFLCSEAVFTVINDYLGQPMPA